jgi:hypothetical protein
VREWKALKIICWRPFGSHGQGANVIDRGKKMGVMRYNGNKGVFFVCAQTKEKGKINYVWKE